MQRNSKNVPTKSISQFYLKVGAILLLDHLTVETEGRFDNASILVYSGLDIILLRMVSLVYIKSKMLSGKKRFICWSFQKSLSMLWSVGDRINLMENKVAVN